MTITCTAYLAMSLDGFIAGPDHDLGWLDVLPPPANNDMGYSALMASVDALVMGRVTFDVVSGFDIPWPYTKPVVVMSKSMTDISANIDNVEVTALEPVALVTDLDARGMSKLYIDGGQVVTSFLQAGLLDELIVTVVPVVLGSGIRLFGELNQPHWFETTTSETFENGMVQTTYRRDKTP